MAGQACGTILGGKYPWALVTGAGGSLLQVNPIYENPGFTVKIKNEMGRKGKENYYFLH